MKKLFFVIGLVTFAVAFYLLRMISQEPKERHIHAGFQVYADGKLQNFSLNKYMSIESCKEEIHEKKTEDEIQEEKAHLHDNVGDVVHSEREGARWKDLFTNIHFSFDRSKQITGYVNGQEVRDIFSYPINAYDSVTIFVGKTDKSSLKNAVTKNKIKEAEKTSEDC